MKDHKNMIFTEASAKENINVEKMFKDLAVKVADI